MIDHLDSTDLDDEIDSVPLYLAFYVGGENYLINVDEVSEVIRVPKLVPVPDVPDYLPGVANLRGRVIPIVDLAVRFNLAKSEQTTRPVVIVVFSGDEQVGLLVEGVQRVLPVPADRMDRKVVADRGTTVIEGVAAIEAGDFLLVDVTRLLAECRAIEVPA